MSPLANSAYSIRSLQCTFPTHLHLHHSASPTRYGVFAFLSGGRHYSGSTTMRLRLASGISCARAAWASAWSTAYTDAELTAFLAAEVIRTPGIWLAGRHTANSDAARGEANEF